MKGKSHIGLLSLLIALSLMDFISCRKEANDNDIDGIKEENKEDVSAYEGSSPKERELIIEGNNRFLAGDFIGADSCYNAALGYNPKSLVAMMNSGLAGMGKFTMMQQSLKDSTISEQDSLAMVGLLQNSLQSFQNAGQPHIKKNNISSLSFFNAGNVVFPQEQYDAAIELYKESLRLNPDDEHARRNLRIAQLRKKDQDQNQQDQNKQDQNQDENQDQQDQQNQNQEQNKDQQQQQQQQNTPQINAQTSDQILEAAERKENQKRLQMKINEQNPEMRGGSRIGW